MKHRTTTSPFCVHWPWPLVCFQATQRSTGGSRPRLLVIRPPEGSGQPNRIVVISSPRQRPKTIENESPPSHRPVASKGSSSVASPQTNSKPSDVSADRSFGKYKYIVTNVAVKPWQIECGVFWYSYAVHSDIFPPSFVFFFHFSPEFVKLVLYTLPMGHRVLI